MVERFCFFLQNNNNIGIFLKIYLKEGSLNTGKTTSGSGH